MFLQKYRKEELKDIEKIGVIMFGLLGDVILRTPVIRALKELYPDAKIVALVDPIGKAVLEHNPDVDEVLVFDRKKEKNKLKQNLKKVASILRVRKEKFDLLVNLYNAGLSRPMVFFSGARYKLGFCQQKSKFLSSMYNVKNECSDDRLKDEQSLYNYMISIVEALSDKKFSLKPVFEVREDEEKAMQEYLDSFGYERDKLYTLNLASSKEDKILEFEKYFFIVEYLYKEYGFIPAIVSNPSQEYLQERFVNEYMKKSDIPYIKLKSLSLGEVAAVIKLTRFIVTPDTGLMHLAMALDSYILTIFTYTHPVFVDPENEKFISVYEGFDEGVLYQKQDIKSETLQKKIDLVVQKLNEGKNKQ